MGRSLPLPGPWPQRRNTHSQGKNHQDYLYYLYQVIEGPNWQRWLLYRKKPMILYVRYICVCVFFQLSHSSGQSLGSLTLPLREVLLEPGMVLDRWLSLDGVLPESQILLRATLRVLLYAALNHLGAMSGLWCIFIESLKSVCAYRTNHAIHWVLKFTAYCYF